MIKFIELTNTLNLPTAINVEEIQGIVEDKECTNISLIALTVFVLVVILLILIMTFSYYKEGGRK